MLNRQAMAHGSVGYVVFEAAAVFADGEKTQSVVFVKRVAKADGGNFHGVRHHFAVKAPAELRLGVSVVMVLLVEIDAVV